MPTFDSETLITFDSEIFVAAGTPSDIAQQVAASLVTSNLVGHDSHGIVQTLKYVGKIRSDDLIPTARPQLSQQQGSTASVDCQWGFGHIGAKYGAEVAWAIAAEAGVGCVTLNNVNHIGRLGEYVDLIARQGLIGLYMTTGSMSGGQVTPYGGSGRRFGTNPMAWGIPVGNEQPPLISDFATSAYSAGKVGVALDEGEALPPGILIDKNGYPTTDPADLAAGGALLPMGSYKGYGLSLVIELVVSILAGFAPASSGDFHQGNPTLILALSIETFTARDRYEALVSELLENVKNTPPAPGFDEVLLPGEVEQRSYAERSRAGIPIPKTTWQQLTELAESLGVAHP